MFETLGSILPNAVAIAISPLPIIAVILLLMSSRAKQMGLSFLLGWCVGILLTTTVSTLLAGVIPEPEESEGSQPVIAVIQLVLGTLLVLLGARQWRSRPAPGEEAELPAWMSKLDSMKAPAVAGLALALAAVNPKNLLLAAAAGTVIGRAGMSVGTTATVIICFTVVGAISVLVPVVIAVSAPQKAASVLANLRTWLGANNATIMTVVFIILGAQVIGKGVGSF